MALGVMLVVAVITIHGVVTSQFRNNATLGYNLIVGPKGGSLQLTLNSVYYLSRPIENMNYRFFLEFFPRQVRDEHIRNSFGYQAHRAAWQTAALGTVTSGGAAVALSSLALEAVERLDRQPLDLGRDGQYANYVDFVIPLCMGDYYGRFRVVGTTPEMFDVLPQYGRPVEFAQGRNFRRWTPEHGFFEAVVGSVVAREMQIQLGDTVNPSHGTPEGHAHENAFTVVGILRPTGTPHDRAVFVNMEGFLLMADHIKPLAEPSDAQASTEPVFPASTPDASNQPSNLPTEEANVAGADGSEHHEPQSARGGVDPRLALQPLPLEQREVTAALVKTANFFVAPRLKNVINEGKEAQVVEPVREIYDLLDMIVGPVQRLLLGLTLMIIVVSGVSILVSIYNSMSERRHEIAVMRALGASRLTVMLVILGESLILAFGGGGVGWLAGHLLNWLAAPMIEERTGVRLGFWDFAPPVNLYEFLGLEPRAEIMVYPELLLIPFLIGLAILVGVIPAIAAYRTDVAESLGK